MSREESSFGDLSRVLRKRYRPALIAALGFFALFSAVVFLLPAVYESRATLLIEQPEVQPELLGGTGSREYVEQRLQRTRQQVLTADNIKMLILKHRLYGVESTDQLDDEVISRFNSNVGVTSQVTGVVDPRTMREANLTYAFDVSFRSDSALLSQALTSELADLFVLSNIQRAELEAEKTISFLRREADRLQADLQQHEERLADFRRSNLGTLPENREQNLFRARDLERDIARVDDDLRAASARKQLLETQLVDMPRNRPLLDEDGQRVISGAERLDAAQQELVGALAKYSDSHPDVRRLRREIERLSTDVEDGAFDGDPSNPAYSQLVSQIESATVDIRELRTRRNILSGDLARVQGAIFRSPEYEKEYTELVRDYDTIKAQYNQMRQRQQLAEVSKKAAGADAVESYVLINPALLPTDPVEPARLALLFLALVLSLFAFFGIISIQEAHDKTVRGTSDIEKLSIPILGYIPRIN